MTKQETFQLEFENHVKEGLTSFPKFLSSKYIYNERGDQLFQQIMNLPEYYLTNAEFNIISEHKEQLREQLHHPDGFDLIELGTGDGKKTKVLLQELVDHKIDVTYIPIDISQHAIDALTGSLKEIMPSLKVQGEQGMYFEVLKRLAQYDKRPKFIMVLGSNIGNFQHDEAIDFLSQLRAMMNSRDLLFMGFDQKKNPWMIQRAYADSQGVTQEFNRNLLHRINNEMEANFPVTSFEHWESYDPETGTAKSFLIATEACEVTLEKLNLTVSFKKWETIHCEISQKYDDDVVNWLANESGLNIVTIYEDSDHLFKDYLFNVKQ